MIKKEKKAIIFDLDNTIYPVAAIGDKLFDELFQEIEQDQGYVGNLEDIKQAVQRQPFQVVAKDYKFNDSLLKKGLQLLDNLEYSQPIKAFEGYELTKNIKALKFLVTTGFSKLQWSKIKQLELEKDFEECIVVDPSKSEQTKKDVFKDIMEKYELKPKEVLIVGDDLHSEIQAGEELGIDTVVYDYNGQHSELTGYNVIADYEKLKQFI